MPKREGEAIRHVVAPNADTLVYLAGQNAIALHVWPSRADRLERPDLGVGPARGVLERCYA